MQCIHCKLNKINPVLQTFFFSNICVLQISGVLQNKNKHFYNRIYNTHMYCFQILNNNNYSVLLNFNLDFEGYRAPLYLPFYISIFCLSNYLSCHLNFHLIIYLSNYLIYLSSFLSNHLFI